jgi:hypothetical protein
MVIVTLTHYLAEPLIGNERNPLTVAIFILSLYVSLLFCLSHLIVSHRLPPSPVSSESKEMLNSATQPPRKFCPLRTLQILFENTALF